MKIFTLLMAGMVAVSASAAGPFSAKKKYVGAGLDYSAKELLENPELMKKAVKASPIWRNAEASIIEYILDAQIWSEPEVHYYQYDKKGNNTVDLMVIEADGVKSRTTNTFNDDNLLVTRLEEDEVGEGVWEKATKREQSYDKVISGYVIKKVDHAVDPSNFEDPWVVTMGSFTKDLTRDTQGRLSGVTISTWFQNEWDPIHKYEIKYDPALGVASELIHTELDWTGAWSTSEKYTNITWDRTNNQPTDLDLGNSFLIGDNRVKRAMFNNGDYDYVIKVTYVADSEDFTAVLTSGDESETHVLATTDANGSFEESFETNADLNGDGNITPDEVEKELRIVKKDAAGRVVEETIYLDETLISSEKVAYTVDPATGNVLEEVREGYFEADPTMGITESGYMPVMKVIYKNYFDVTTQGGVENVGSDNFSVKVLDDAVEVALNGMTGYSIYGLNGAVVANGGLNGSSATISISDLANGVYMLRVNAENDVKIIKFVKK